MPDQATLTPLQKALADACRFAIAHGVNPFDPADFGIHDNDSGLTTATYIDADYAVTAYIDHYGHAKFGVAELDWVHLEVDEDRDICDHCEVIDPRDLSIRPVVDVQLPEEEPSNA